MPQGGRDTCGTSGSLAAKLTYGIIAGQTERTRLADAFCTANVSLCVSEPPRRRQGCCVTTQRTTSNREQGERPSRKGLRRPFGERKSGAQFAQGVSLRVGVPMNIGGAGHAPRDDSSERVGVTLRE